MALGLLLFSGVCFAQPEIHLTFGALNVASGPADRAQWTAIVSRQRARLRFCYEQGLQGLPELAGSVAITMTVAADGTTADVEIARRSMTRVERLENCLIRTVRTLRGPSLDASSRVGFVVTFSAERPPPPAPPADATGPSTRAELTAARSEARCLSRAAARLERVLAQWEAASNRGRERLASQLAEARSAIGMCRAPSWPLGSGQLAGVLGAGQQCPAGCRPVGGGIDLRSD